MMDEAQQPTVNARANARADAWLANSWSENQQDKVRAAYTELSSHPSFGIIVEDLARYAGVRRTSFTPGQSDQMHFAEGQRDLVMHLLEMAGIDLVFATRTTTN